MAGPHRRLGRHDHRARLAADGARAVRGLGGVRAPRRGALGREDHLREEIERQFATVHASLDEVVAWVVENVACAPGFPELAALHPLVVSSGFHELIDPVLEREGVEVELAGEPDRGAAGRLAADLARAAVCSVCGQPCKRSSFPPTARSSTSATATPTAAARSPPTGSSPGAGSPSTSTSRACATSGSTTCTPLLLRFPEPYDFEVSTERFRAFGPDLANLWHEGGLHRVVGGREVRIEAAPGRRATSSRSTTATEAESCGCCSARRSTSTPFYAWAAADPVVRRLAKALAGFRPPLAPDPFESLVTSITAQQVSLFAAFAIRNRFIERFGERGRARVRVPDARAGRARRARTSSSRSASRAARPSTSSGSRAPTSTSTGSPRCPTTR